MSTTETTALRSAGTEASEASGMDSFAAMFEATPAAKDFGKEGEIVKGTVVAVTRDIRQAMPVVGSFVGDTDAFHGMVVEVSVTA